MNLNDRLQMLTQAEKTRLNVAFESGTTQCIIKGGWFVGVYVVENRRLKIEDTHGVWSTGIVIGS